MKPNESQFPDKIGPSKPDVPIVPHGQQAPVCGKRGCGTTENVHSRQTYEVGNVNYCDKHWSDPAVRNLWNGAL